MDIQLKDRLRDILGIRRYDALAVLVKAPQENARIKSWTKTAQAGEARRRLAELRGRYQGQRGFVIGNGPSLNKMNLTPLAQEITIGSNGIFLAFERFGFVPSYYTIEDRLVAEDRAREAALIVGAQRVYPHDLACVLGEVGDPIYVSFHRTYRGFPKFSTDLSTGGFWGGTVTVFNLQLAFHLGCDPVYLIGCDHNYIVKQDVQKKRGLFTSVSDDPNHFDPSYFGKGYRWHDPNVDRMAEGYRVCRAQFEAQGRKIFNATAGGHLEVFERIDFSSLFRNPQQSLGRTGVSL